jgi:hypothetical protein
MYGVDVYALQSAGRSTYLKYFVGITQDWSFIRAEVDNTV